MSRKTLLILTIFLAFFIINASFIIQSKKNDTSNVNNKVTELEPYFNNDEISYILNNNISFDNIKPYLNYQTFNIYNFHLYEQLRTLNNLSYLETINYFNYPQYYNYDQSLGNSLFKDSNLILVNKNFYLDEDYQPKNLIDVKTVNISFIKRDDEETLINKEVLEQYHKLYQDALKFGYELYIFSAYRDYQKQKILYYFINNEDNQISAKPGYSEHQSGLALDISTLQWGLSNYLEYSDEFKWLKQNAHKYGFILRYPKDKEIITGYNFEPWHFRYIGKEHAKTIYEMNLSLEEYLFKSFELK